MIPGSMHEVLFIRYAICSEQENRPAVQTLNSVCCHAAELLLADLRRRVARVRPRRRAPEHPQATAYRGQAVRCRGCGGEPPWQAARQHRGCDCCGRVGARSGGRQRSGGRCPLGPAATHIRALCLVRELGHCSATAVPRDCANCTFGTLLHTRFKLQTTLGAGCAGTSGRC